MSSEQNPGWAAVVRMTNCSGEDFRLSFLFKSLEDLNYHANLPEHVIKRTSNDCAGRKAARLPFVLHF